MRMSEKFCTRIHADFYNLCIININTKHEVPIPKNILVNPYSATRLKKMFPAHNLITLQE